VVKTEKNGDCENKLSVTGGQKQYELTCMLIIQIKARSESKR
jgi:hypothetical protein